VTSVREKFFRISLCCLAVVWVGLCVPSTVSAQIPSPGYTFVEVRDESDKPIANAIGIVYDESGAEIGSGVTDARGEAAVVQHRPGAGEWIFRVIKSGYVVYEGVLKPGGEYTNLRVPVKLIRRGRSKPITPQGTSPPP
jgi:hypothetical protein